MGHPKRYVLMLVWLSFLQSEIGFSGELEDQYVQLSYESGLVYGFSRGFSAMTSNLCWIKTPAPDLGESTDSLGKLKDVSDPLLVGEKIRFFKQILDSFDGRLSGLIAPVRTPFLQEDLRRVRVKLNDILQSRDSSRSCFDLPEVLQALGALEEKILRTETDLLKRIRSTKSTFASLPFWSSSPKMTDGVGVGLAPASVSALVPTPVVMVTSVPAKAAPPVEKRSVQIQVGSPQPAGVDRSTQMTQVCMSGGVGVDKIQRVPMSSFMKSKVPNTREEDDPYKLRERVQLDGIGVQIVGLKKLTLNEGLKREFENFVYASTVGAMKRVDAEYAATKSTRYSPEISVTVIVNKIDLLLNCLGKFKGYIAEVEVAAEVDRSKTYPVRKLSFTTEIRYKDKGWYQSAKDVGFQSELSSLLLRELQTSLDLKSQEK